MELGFGAPTGKHMKTRYREAPTTLSNIDTTSTTQLCCWGSCCSYVGDGGVGLKKGGKNM